MKIPANGFTHAGKFHADDVFATALLQILRPDIKITRGFVVPDDFDGIVYDLSLIHISEPTRRTPISYAVFCLKKKKTQHPTQDQTNKIITQPPKTI